MCPERIYDSITELIGHTPLIRLKKIASELNGVELLGKLESFNPGGSVKDRPCLAMIEDAVKKEYIKLYQKLIGETKGKNILSLVDIKNTASMNAHAKMGFNVVKKIKDAYQLRKGEEQVLWKLRSDNLKNKSPKII